MSGKEISVNEDIFDTVSIDIEDESLKYTIVPNSLIRDMEISPNCRWLIIHLLSLKSIRIIKLCELYEYTKKFIGKDHVRKALKEAIQSGYIEKTIDGAYYVR